MITGYVNSKLEGMISLSVYESKAEAREIEAVIDTGYAGQLTLPSEVVAELGLSSIGIGQLILADGSEVPSALCLATVVWDNQRRTGLVDTLESEALIGMGLLEGHDLNMHVTVGGLIKIESFSQAQPPTE